MVNISIASQIGPGVMRPEIQQSNESLIERALMNGKEEIVRINV